MIPRAALCRSAVGLAVLLGLANACSSSSSGAGPEQAGNAGVSGALAAAGAPSAGATSNGGNGGTVAGSGGASAGAGGQSYGGAGAGSGGTAAGAGGASAGAAGASAGAGGALPAVELWPAYTSNAAALGTNTAKRNSGREFIVTGAGIRVRDVGVWDSKADGLNVAHPVTLFSLDKVGAGAKATPVPGGSATVPAGTAAPLDAGFRYAALPAPIDLKPGTYAVVAYGLNDKDLTGSGGGLPLPALGVTDAHFDPYQNVDAASPAFPNGGDTNNHSNASFHFEVKKKPLRILPFGASITDGYLGTMAGYRGPLLKLFDDAGILMQFVGSSIDNPGTVPLPREQQHHEGHSGYVIIGGTSGRSGIYDSRQDWLGPSGSQADVILIIIGSNDVSLDYQLATAGERLDALVTAILDPATGLQPHAKVILAQLPTILDATQDARCVTYNQAVVSVVNAHQKKGEPISTVDLHSVITAADHADNLHPNDVGYQNIAKVWFDAIQKL